MEAEVIAIGPFSVLKEYDALSYPIEFYQDTSSSAIVIGNVAHADARSEVESLAYMCNVDVWDLGHHKVTELTMLTGLAPFTNTVGEQYIHDVYYKLINLLNDGVDLWFIPIG